MSDCPTGPTNFDTTAIKPEKLRILGLDIWGTVSVFIFDLNADIRGGFTNLTADYHAMPGNSEHLWDSLDISLEYLNKFVLLLQN